MWDQTWKKTKSRSKKWQGHDDRGDVWALVVPPSNANVNTIGTDISREIYKYLYFGILLKFLCLYLHWLNIQQNKPRKTI